MAYAVSIDDSEGEIYFHTEQEGWSDDPNKVMVGKKQPDWMFRKKIIEKSGSEYAPSERHIYTPKPHLLFPNSFLAVSREMKSLIEQLEPRVHQFVPCEFNRTYGEPRCEKYFSLNILTLLDGVIVDRLRPPFHSGNIPPLKPSSRGLIAEANFTLSAAAIEGHHVWRGCGRVSFDSVLFSDELGGAVIAAGMCPIIGLLKVPEAE